MRVTPILGSQRLILALPLVLAQRAPLRWNEAGQTVEQLQRRQRELPTAVGAWLIEAGGEMTAGYLSVPYAFGDEPAYFQLKNLLQLRLYAMPARGPSIWTA